ncbi:MAG: (R,R)-butanediol dehydrogenase / meso-butanediol dehydrogenase / diacetyl reductase [Clostridiales bacterium]|jgi:L-iditol 2-dehydrogenase|nr:(R,R)-butanediol dehydrogenase / meso-butanediol dehydrogenase / diacetyl reductase [Clostridiales bacterium]
MVYSFAITNIIFNNKILSRHGGLTKMKALVYHGPEYLKWEDIEDVSPGKDEVLIKVKAVGICGSDVHGYLGITGRRIPPMVMGHEFSGIIEEVGEGVTTLKPGDRVAPYPVVFCGECDFCKQGKPHMCRYKKALGVLECNGAMAEYVCIPAKVVFKLADNVSYNVGSMIEPMAVAYRGVNTAGDISGKNVMIVGAGTIGLLVLAVVKMRNPAKVFVSDLSDNRLSVAKEMGADFVINPSKENINDIIKNETNGAGIDIALEAVGATPTVQQAMASLKIGGTAVWIGNSAKMININMQEIVTRELKVFGSFLYTFQEFGEIVDLLSSGKLNVEPMISLTAPMEQGVELFKRLAKDPGPLIKVILTD